MSLKTRFTLNAIAPSLPLGAACLMLAGVAIAQAPAPSPGNPLPEACRMAAQAGSGPSMMRKMDEMRSSDTGARMLGEMNAMTQQMGETHRGLMQAMQRMQPAMMEGMMAADADVAWICAMIPHHQGAIDMARAGLAGSDNAESRRMAQETIRMQEDEIAKLTAWVERNATRESRNEATGTLPK
jgi:hypothetical protein